MSGVPVEAVYGPADAERPGAVPVHARAVRVDVSVEALDDAHVRGLRHRDRHEPPLPRVARRRQRRPLDRVRPADADGPRLRRRARARRGRQVRRRGRHARRHRGPLPRHRPRRGHHVDDDQRSGRGDLRDVRRERGGERRRTRRGSAARCRTTSSRSTRRRRSSSSRPGRRCGSCATRSRSARAEMPRWHPISISGYHIREAGSTAAQELAFTVANGFAYVELALARRPATSTRSRRACRSSSTRTSTSSKRSRSTAPRVGSGRAGCATATARRTSARCRCGSTRRRPACRSPRSSPRSTSCAPRSRRSRACSAARRACTRTRWTRRSRCRRRRRRGSRCAPSRSSRTRPASTNVADPLGGSWYVEALTDEMERRAEEIFARDRGAAATVRCSTARSAASRRVGTRARSPTPPTSSSARSTRAAHVVVGVNAFLEGNDEPPPPILRIGPEVEEEQRRRLEKVKHERNAEAVERALSRVRAEAADPTST